MYTLYMLYSYETNKYYVGMTCKSLSQRLYQHKHAALTGKKSPLYDCMRKYGVDKFKMNAIVSFDNKEDCCTAEILHIKSCRAFNDCLLNLASGGEGGYVIPEASREAWKAKLSKARQGRKPALGMKHTEETKELCGEYAKSRWDAKGRYPKEVTRLSFKDAHEKFNISKTHYYRLLKRAKRNELS